MRLILLALVFFAYHFSLGQKYLGQADLSTVNSNGYYRINVGPGLTQYFTDGFANVRILNNSNQEVPYLLDHDLGFSSWEFREYAIEAKTFTPGCCTEIVFRNNPDSAINNIHLRIKNADVEKEARLLGSDDQQRWFSLKDRFRLNRINNLYGTSELRIVDFPLIDYKYVKIQVDDSLTAPLNIESVGYYKSFSRLPKFHKVPGTQITVKTLKKQNLIRVKLDTTHFVDRVEINVSGPPLFLRKATLFSVTYRLNKKGIKEEIHSHVSNLELTHSVKPVVDMDSQVRELLLVVENDDNPPLTFDSVNVLQLNRYMIAYLERDKKYELKFADGNASAPVYDIALFKDKLSGTLPAVDASSPVIYAVSKPTSSTFFTENYMWFAIAAVIILLGFLSVKMITDMKNSKTQE